MESKMNDAGGDLWDTIRAIWGEDYDDLPKGLLRRIVEIERENLEDETTAVREIQEAVESHLEAM